MKLALSLCAALATALSACAVAPPPPPPPASAPILPQSAATHRLVTANPDARRIIGAFHARSLHLAPSDVSRVDLLAGSPGYAWGVGPDWLHIHVYRDRAAASAAAGRFVSTATSRSQIIGWVGKPHLFHCGTAVALYLGETAQALNVLGALCGPPVWVR